MDYIWPIYWIWVGLCVGSFLNVVAYRLPRRWRAQKDGQTENLLSVSSPARSFCPKCGHQIRWTENIPVLSFLFLRGRCATCKNPIHWRYPLVETIVGLVYAIAVLSLPALLAVAVSIAGTLAITAFLLLLSSRERNRQ